MRGLRRFAVVPVLLALAALLPACGADHDPGVVRVGVNDLALLGATEIFPLNLYSKKHESVADIPPGGEITLNNNPANHVRPLLGPAAAGLIVLKGGVDWDSRIEDVDTAASRVRLTPIDPALTAQ
ncbi:MetQ/NlpA family ABC transporter substrate-binding protein [Nocardia sp. NPDC002869]|uniref:MetQ/NlpA family ABC transporter substrate-binding protein n=1 Tax=Nocardia sp. NPDC002869 TaxID=3161032 RepID=UPI00398CC98A